MQPKTPSETETPSASAVSSDLVRGLKDAAAWFRLNGDPDGAKRLMEELAALDPQAAKSLAPRPTDSAPPPTDSAPPPTDSSAQPLDSAWELSARPMDLAPRPMADPTPPPMDSALQPRGAASELFPAAEQQPAASAEASLHEAASELPVPASALIPVRSENTGTHSRLTPTLPPEVKSPLPIQPHRDLPPYSAQLDDAERLGLQARRGRSMVLIGLALCLPVVTAYVVHRALSRDEGSAIVRPVSVRNAPPLADGKPAVERDPVVPLPAAPDPALAAVPQVRWKLTSTPSGADVVRMDTGEKLGRTPLELDVDQAEEAAGLRFLLPSHRPIEVKASRKDDATVSVSFVKPAPAVSTAKKQRPSSKAKSRKNNRDDLLDPYGN